MGWSLSLSACDDREWWGGEDRGLLRCWGLSCLSVAWLITEANSKRIAGGNKDTSMSAVSSSEGPIRQMDAYWQARDGKERAGERWRRGERGWTDGGSVPESLTLARAAMSADPVAITLQPLSRLLFKAKQISGSECHHKDTRGLISTNQCPGFQITLSPSPADKSIFLVPTPGVTPPFDPWLPHWGAVTEQQIYDPPISLRARFIDISYQLSFWEIAHGINFNYILMLNILETLNFMVGDAQSRMSIYQAPRLHWKTLSLSLFFFFRL